MKLGTLAVLSLLTSFTLAILGTGCASTGAPRAVNHARLDSRSDMGSVLESPRPLRPYHTSHEAQAPEDSVF
jgi:hypothetical protein